MKIPFSEISATGTRYSFSDLSVPFKENDFDLQGPVELSCTLQRKGQNRVVLKGRVQAAILLSCNRCLTDYSFQVQSDMHLIYEVVEAEHWQVKELDLSAVDLDIIELSEPVIDLEDIARQQLYIALPVRQVCAEQCKGFCPDCGINLNENSCSCSGQETNSPFAVLAALKK